MLLDFLIVVHDQYFLKCKPSFMAYLLPKSNKNEFQATFFYEKCQISFKST